MLVVSTALGQAPTVSKNASHNEIRSYTAASFVYVNDSLRLAYFLRGDSTLMPSLPIGSAGNLVFRGRGGLWYQTANGAFRLDSVGSGSIDSGNFVKYPDTLDMREYSTFLYQLKDSDLTAIAAITATGTVRRTGTNTWTATPSDTAGLAASLAGKQAAGTYLVPGDTITVKNSIFAGQNNFTNINTFTNDVQLSTESGYTSIGTSAYPGLLVFPTDGGGMTSISVFPNANSPSFYWPAKGSSGYTLAVTSDSADGRNYSNYLYVPKGDSGSGINYTTNKRLGDSMAVARGLLSSTPTFTSITMLASANRTITGPAASTANGYNLSVLGGPSGVESGNGGHLNLIGGNAAQIGGNVYVYGGTGSSSANAGGTYIGYNGSSIFGKTYIYNNYAPMTFNDSVQIGSTNWGKNTYCFVKSGSSGQHYFKMLYSTTYHTDWSEKECIAYNNDFTFQTAQNKDIIFQCNGASERLRLYGAGGAKITGNFVINNTVSSYNAINTVGNGIAAEYATVDLTAQAAAIGTTTLYAVPAAGAGQYRLQWNAKVTQAATTSSLLGGLTITYVDPDGTTQTINPCAAQSNAGLIIQYSTANTTATVLLGSSMLLNCKASTNITYAFAYASTGATTMQYNLHVRLEGM